MIPTAWQFSLLALSAFRLTRLASYDDLPPVARLRARLLGETWRAREGEEPHAVYTRPLLAHLVGCPFCIGAWVSLAVYLAWLAAPHATLLVLVPFALSGAVGLIAKNLDA